MNAHDSVADARDSIASGDRRALFLCLGYLALTFTLYCVWKRFMAERSVDEAYFENILWNATHGNGLRTLVEGAGGRGLSHLALHFTPAVYLLVPLYALFPSMHVVHLVVALGVAASGYLVYRLGRDALGPGAATLVMAAFLLNPTVILQTFMECHEQALAFLPLMALVVSYQRQSLAFCLAAGLVFVAIREENALLVLALGALALFTRRDLAMGTALLALGAGWLAFYRWFAVGQLAGGQISHLFSGTYGIWGDTPGRMLRALLADPVRALRHMLSMTPLVYLVQLLGPFLGVLGFGSPLVLVALPQILLILLADHQTRMFNIRMHYSIVPVVMLTVGAIGTLAWLHRRRVTLRVGGRRVPAEVVAAALMLAASVATMPLWAKRAIERLNPNTEEVREVMAMVPDTVSLTAPDYMLVQMAKRRHIAKTWDGPLTTTEYVILEDRERLHYPGTIQDTPYSPEAARTLEAAGYVPVYERNGIHLWRRSGAGTERP